jgi:glyoxylase-like metal-dependent hydrolase (beta-lactamase superfamily II)
MASGLPEARELAPGLVRWVAFHPEWKQDVACLALRSRKRLVLIDPLVPHPAGRKRAFWAALDELARASTGPVDVVLTLHYHERSSAQVVERYRDAPGAVLWAPAGSVRRMTHPPDRAFTPGDALPAGMEALATGREDEVVLWLPAQRAVVSGDVLLGGVRKPLRVCPKSWLPRGVARSDVARALGPLRELPVELVVPLHGEPVTTAAREVLARALDEAS